MRRPYKKTARLLQTVCWVPQPGHVTCGLCRRTVKSPYQTGIPAPCGCNWLRYGRILAAFPNRDAQRQRILARNRRRARAAGTRRSP